MPIDLYSTINKTSQWAFGSPVLNAILGSSVFVALVVALLMVVIVMVMYPAKSGTPFSVVMKMFVYMAAGTLLVIFLHDGVLKYMMEEESAEDDADAFMQNTTMGGRQADPSYGMMYQQIAPTPQPMPQPMPQPQPMPVETQAPISGGLPIMYPPKSRGNMFAV